MSTSISHVFNYDLSNEPENHIHRIGRTARAGADGVAVSFCDHEQLGLLRAIEKLMRKKIEVVGEEPEHIVPHKSPRSSHPNHRQKPRSGQRGGQRRNNKHNQTRNESDGNSGGPRKKHKSKSGQPSRGKGKGKGHAAGMNGFKQSQNAKGKKAAKTGSGCAPKS